ncbi:hypothetical protein Tco_1257436, partial [Tanacetum coccineum]
YEWKPPRCACCKVFGHVLEECPKNIGVAATNNLKKTSQTPKRILVGQKMGFKPKQVYQPVSKKSTANTCGKKMNNLESTKDVSKSYPFEVLTSIDNDVDLGKLRFVDDDGKPLVPMGIVDSNSEVEVVFDETANLRILTSGKAYDDDMYENYDMFEHLQSICDDLDITPMIFYIDILKKHGIDKCDSIGTPMATSPKLDAYLSGTPVDKTRYQSMIGSLMYLTSSRPGLMQAICYCACYQSRPTEKCLKEVKRIFWYLMNTINIGLWYLKDFCFELTAFSDVDHAGCLDTRKNTYGGMQFLGDKMVSWMSKKKDCVAMSTVKDEYVALSASCA